MTFNGIDPRSLVPGILSIKTAVDAGMPPKTVNMETMQRGAAYAGYQFGARPIKVSINVGARSRQASLEAVRLLAGWAHSEMPMPLVLPHEPDKYYLAICTGMSDKTFQGTFVVVDVSFLASDPHAYDLAPSTASFGAAFSVGGTAPIQPLLTITASKNVTDARFVLDTDQYIQLRGTIKKNEVVALDCAARTVKIGSQLRPTLLDYIETRWFVLSPGTHAITSTAAGTSEILWHNAWL